MNVMKNVQVGKVVLNIGVGEGGDKLEKAEKVLSMLSGKKPIRTISKTTNRELGLRKGIPIGCKVTLRGDNAEGILRKSLWVRENKMPLYCFSKTGGGLSFGIPDYTAYEEQRYDPDVGIFGLDVCVSFERPGYRISRRKQTRKKIGQNHRVSKEDCQKFMTDKFGLEVL